MCHSNDARFHHLMRSIPEFWECFAENEVKQFQCVGRARLPRSPRHCGTRRVRTRRQRPAHRSHPPDRRHGRHRAQCWATIDPGNTGDQHHDRGPTLARVRATACRIRVLIRRTAHICSLGASQGAPGQAIRPAPPGPQSKLQVQQRLAAVGCSIGNFACCSLLTVPAGALPAWYERAATSPIAKQTSLPPWRRPSPARRG